MAFRFTIHGVPIRVQTGVRPLRWVRKHGITIGRTIFLAPHHTQVWPELLAHEFCHVGQWEDRGVFGFLWGYLVGLVTHGYGLKHPDERDAYKYAVTFANTPPFVEACRTMGWRG